MEIGLDAPRDEVVRRLSEIVDAAWTLWCSASISSRSVAGPQASERAEITALVERMIDDKAQEPAVGA